MATGWTKPKLEKNCNISSYRHHELGLTENLRVEVKADSDVRSDDRRRKEETRFLWNRLSLNTSIDPFKPGPLPPELSLLPLPWCENVGRVFLVSASPYSVILCLTQGEQPITTKLRMTLIKLLPLDQEK